MGSRLQQHGNLGSEIWATAEEKELVVNQYGPRAHGPQGPREIHRNSSRLICVSAVVVLPYTCVLLS